CGTYHYIYFRTHGRPPAKGPNIFRQTDTGEQREKGTYAENFCPIFFRSTSRLARHPPAPPCTHWPWHLPRSDPELPLRLDLEALQVAIDRSHRQHLAVAAIAHQAVARGNVAVDLDRIPFFRVAGVVDRHVVVLAPEERHVGEALAGAEHVFGRGLALPLGHDPVLGPDRRAAV